MVFQQQIPKRRELRIIFVSGTLFIGTLDASRYESQTMDWRQATGELIPWESGAVPQQVSHCLKLFMAELGLSFGAIDMIETPDGEYFFLEVNPVGEWGMIERDLNYPISAAIADALLL
jgi:glutathione synthase/RimK-type ligase-like ATP-grasp enzyme